MELKISKAGMLTTVQDLGRWGHQSDGVPVAGAMDLEALRFGNAMLGNDENAAALEVTIIGPEITAGGEGLVLFAGADLGFSVNDREVGAWRAVPLKNGDILSFSGPRTGCRGYICFAGGIDVPVVMGSRSTYTRASIGGYQGRALKNGDLLQTGEPCAAWRRLAGFTLPNELRPDYSLDKPLKILMGLQADAFTEEGLETLFSAEYTVSTETDRMGSRFDGPKIAHGEKGADIVSDAIPMGAVQIPGHGTPIAMLADRQTTGGYTKVGVLSPASVQTLVQRMPGSKVRFEKCQAEDAVAELRKTRDGVLSIKRLGASYISAPDIKPCAVTREETVKIRSFRLTVGGKSCDVTCEEISLTE